MGTGYWKMFEPRVPGFLHVPTCYPYRYQGALAGETVGEAAARELEEAILREGPDTVAAFIAEPVGGSSTGASVPPKGHYKRIREICDKHDVVFIADEVLVGAGRTGKWAAMEHFGVSPDIMTMAKGISAGVVPLSAVLASRRIVDPIAKASGGFKHAQTFSHSPSICAAGLAAVRYIRKHDMVGRCAKMGAILHRKLKALLDLPAVGDVRGIGLLAGIEFVADKKTKAPFPRRLLFAETFTDRAQEAGLMVWPNVGQADGENGDLVCLAPPFVIKEAEIDEIVSRFKTALERTQDDLRVRA
jgi:adenosylmethionine-8-amino-7-oxononanoate aminotransferase